MTQKYLKLLAQYLLGLLILIAGVVSTFDFVYRKYLPQLKSPTPPIAMMGESQGAVKFRNAFDTIWLPSFKGSSIFSGDYIQTDSSSKTRLYFGLATKKSKAKLQKEHGSEEEKKPDKNYIDILEDSFVKVSLDRGSIRIKLIEGDVVAVVDPDSFSVVVQRGSEDSVIKKGPPKDEAPPPQPKEENKTDEPKNDPKNTSSETKERKPKPVNPFSFTTTPKNSSTLLFIKDQDTFFEFGEKCPDNCELKLWNGQNLIKTATFKSGQLIRVEFPVNSSTFGIYRWEIGTDESTFMGGFSILPFTKENLDRAKKEKSNMEVVL